MSAGAGSTAVRLERAARPNLSATCPGTGNGRSLVLNGHIDVVSAEPESWWTHAPFSGTVDRGRLYRRGAYDMKGGLVAAAVVYLASPAADFITGTVLPVDGGLTMR